MFSYVLAVQQQVLRGNVEIDAVESGCVILRRLRIPTQR
jgi:hypothetical protein